MPEGRWARALQQRGAAAAAAESPEDPANVALCTVNRSSGARGARRGGSSRAQGVRLALSPRTLGASGQQQQQQSQQQQGPAPAAAAAAVVQPNAPASAQPQQTQQQQQQTTTPRDQGAGQSYEVSSPFLGAWVGFKGVRRRYGGIRWSWGG